MKNFLFLFAIILTSACTRDVILDPTPEVEEENFDIAQLGIFGKWELLDSGSFSCPNDIYTFHDNGTFMVETNNNCGDIIVLSPLPISSVWTATENSFTLGLNSINTYTIITKDNSSMRTSNSSDIHQNWLKIE